MLLNPSAKKKPVWTALEGVKTLPEPSFCVVGCPQSLPKSFPLTWEYLELLQTSCPEKKGVCSWKSILENLTQEIAQGYIMSLWADLLEHSPGPASHLGRGMVRAQLPSLLTSRPMFFTVGREWTFKCFSLKGVHLTCLLHKSRSLSMPRAGGWSMRNISQLFSCRAHNCHMVSSHSVLRSRAGICSLL